jgi:hypothetical protein
VGIVEKAFGEFDFTVDIASVDLRDVFTIPEHRIQYFKFNDAVIWDKRDGQRVDLVFGSFGGSSLRDTLVHLGAPLPLITTDADDTLQQAQQAQQQHQGRGAFATCFNQRPTNQPPT